MQTESHLLNDPQSLLKAIIICLNQLLGNSHNDTSDSIFNLKTAPTLPLSQYVIRTFSLMQD